MVYVTDGELLIECNGHFDTHIKWAINYVLMVWNKYKSIANLDNDLKKNWL